MVSRAQFRLLIHRLMVSFSSVREDEHAATAIEYALIAALISIAIIGGATYLGSQLSSEWVYVANVVSPQLGH